MKVSEVIKALAKLQKFYGDVEVYCPNGDLNSEPVQDIYINSSRLLDQKWIYIDYEPPER